MDRELDADPQPQRWFPNLEGDLVSGYAVAKYRVVASLSDEETAARGLTWHRDFARSELAQIAVAAHATPKTSCLRNATRRSTRPRGAGRPRARALARSSSRGGDSGDDGPGSSEGDGEPPPPPGLANLPPRRKLCACGCGASLEGRRANARYFDGACRIRGSRVTTASASRRPGLEAQHELDRVILGRGA